MLAKTRNINLLHRESLTRLERFAKWIAQRVGSAGFFLAIVIWTASWFIWNTIGPERLRFDAFPAFVLWIFVSNMIQLFLLPLLLIGQNLQSRHSEFVAETDYETNVRAEQEIETVLERLKKQEETLNEIKQRLK